MYMMTPIDALQLACKLASEAECHALNTSDSDDESSLEKNYKSTLAAAKTSELYMKLYSVLEERERNAGVRTKEV